jgi:uncharacterized protein (DUF849 family)
LIRQWEVLPDFASVNMDEAGALDVVKALLDQGVGVEAGLADTATVNLLADSGLAARCLRILIEPDPHNLAEARTAVAAVETALDHHRISRPRLLHGSGAATWGILRDAAERGYDTRIGLEDTLTLPDGSLAPDNAALVRAALDIINSFHKKEPS